MALPKTSDKMTVYHVDQLNGRNSETWYTPLKASDIDSDTAIAITHWARNLITSLSTDTYEDVIVVSTVSLEEKGEG